MDRVEILYDLSSSVQMKPQRFGSNLLGVPYNNFSKKGARNLGANSRNPGANSRNPGAILKSGGLLFYLL